MATPTKTWVEQDGGRHSCESEDTITCWWSPERVQSVVLMMDARVKGSI